MAYDPVKAHEYYEKYIKKGLRKGRKKKSTDTKKSGKKGRRGSSKSAAKKTSLVGVSSSGLNNAGRIEAALAKERITKEMNAALAKETTDEGREKVRREYSQKAQAEMDKLKNDPKFAEPKKAKAAKSSSGSKGSSPKSEASKKTADDHKTIVKSGSKDSASMNKYNGKSIKATTSHIGGKQSAPIISTKAAAEAKEREEAAQQRKAERSKMVKDIKGKINELQRKISDMSEEERRRTEKTIRKTIDSLKKQIKS